MKSSILKLVVLLVGSMSMVGCATSPTATSGYKDYDVAAFVKEVADSCPVITEKDILTASISRLETLKSQVFLCAVRSSRVSRILLEEAKRMRTAFEECPSDANCMAVLVRLVETTDLIITQAENAFNLHSLLEKLIQSKKCLSGE